MHVRIRLIGFTGVVIMAGFGGLGGYIADLTERRAQAADTNDTSSGANLTRKACDWVARKGIPGAAAPQAHYMCGPYWDDAPYDPPQDVPKPFEGGQCDALYRLIETVNPNCEGEVENTRFSNVQGPISIGSISQISERPDSTEECPKFLWQTPFTPATGNTLNLNSVSSGAPTWRAERMDGLPDECGDDPNQPPPRDPVDLPPGTLPPDGSPVDISDPNNPSDSPPPIVFAPDPPPEYEPFVPFAPSIPGGPPFAFPPGPGDDIPPRVGPETDLPAGGTDGEDVETPEDDLPDECIGYSWEFYDIPANRGGIPGATPARFYEIFGSAQLRVSSRDNALYDIPVKIDSERGVCYRSDKNLRVRGLSLNSKVSFGPVRVRPVYVVVREN